MTLYKAPNTDGSILQLQTRQANFIGGEWVAPRKEQYFENISPVNGQVIGEVPRMNGAYMGFGHHHIGLTGGPKTGRLLSQLISGRKPNIDLTPYSPARFAMAAP